MTDREKLIELIGQEVVPYFAERIADHLLANGVAFAKNVDVPSKWISVEERLPKPGVVVLVHSKLGCTYFSHRLHNYVDGKPFSIEYSGGWNVTHWMPLPEAPKEM